MLAQSDLEPLVLADGTVIDPTTGKAVKQKRSRTYEVPAPSEAQAIVLKARKTVADLPAPPEQMSAVGIVAFYTLFGLDDNSIAIATKHKLTVDQIKNIRQLDIYRDFMKEARTTIMESEAENVRHVLAERAREAAERVIEHMDSDNDVLSFKAAQDILDRTGNRPADIVEHRHKMENALQIVVTRKDNNAGIPTLEGEYENIQ